MAVGGLASVLGPRGAPSVGRGWSGTSGIRRGAAQWRELAGQLGCPVSRFDMGHAYPSLSVGALLGVGFGVGVQRRDGGAWRAKRARRAAVLAGGRCAQPGPMGPGLCGDECPSRSVGTVGRVDCPWGRSCVTVPLWSGEGHGGRGGFGWWRACAIGTCRAGSCGGGSPSLTVGADMDWESEMACVRRRRRIRGGVCHGARAVLNDARFRYGSRYESGSGSYGGVVQFWTGIGDESGNGSGFWQDAEGLWKGWEKAWSWMVQWRRLGLGSGHDPAPLRVAGNEKDRKEKVPGRRWGGG
jgi:hypothetical protein